MKKKTLLLLMALCLATAGSAAGTADTLTVRIKGMRCEECAHKVKDVLGKVAGFERVSFDLERRTATIAYDPQQTSRDTIEARLAATHRYKASAYDPAEVIRRGIGVHVDDMHCQKCADRIVARLSQMAGIDSLAPHLKEHYLFVRYDANKTSKSTIHQALLDLGYTPVSHYTSKSISFAYFMLPAEMATEETAETALALDGVDDATVSTRRHSLAITFVNTETTQEKLLEQLQAEGIKAELPAPHECKEE